MDNKKYTMAELLAEYGDGFDKMNKYDNIEEPQEEKQEQIKQEEPQQKDITIKCKKCEQDFIWSVKDQEFYKEKGFFKPSYCKDCRKKTKVVNNFHKDV